MATSFVAVDRVVARGRSALLLRRAHACDAGPAIAEGALDRSFTPVEMHLVDAISDDDDGQVNVVVGGTCSRPSSESWVDY